MQTISNLIYYEHEIKKDKLLNRGWLKPHNMNIIFWAWPLKINNHKFKSIRDVPHHYDHFISKYNTMSIFFWKNALYIYMDKFQASSISTSSKTNNRPTIRRTATTCTELLKAFHELYVKIYTIF